MEFSSFFDLLLLYENTRNQHSHQMANVITVQMLISRSQLFANGHKFRIICDQHVFYVHIDSLPFDCIHIIILLHWLNQFDSFPLVSSDKVTSILFCSIRIETIRNDFEKILHRLRNRYCRNLSNLDGKMVYDDETVRNFENIWNNLFR